jgi:tetratricopeptide (TPR) repeat protein
MNAGELIKIGRNQECPCGSGKKYKRCCLKSGGLRLSSYEITTGPMEELNNEDDFFSREEYELYADLGEKLVAGEVTNFNEAVEFLEELKRKYPPQKRVYNLLAVCYERVDRDNDVEKIIKEGYELFPDYLFARTGYVSYWMQKDDYTKFDEVFGNCYDLKMLYPEREVFHISEAFSFFIVCGRYFGNKGNSKVAERYLNMAAELKPDNPQLGLVENEIMLGQIKKLRDDKKFRDKFFSLT